MSSFQLNKDDALLCPVCKTDKVNLGFVQGEQQKFSTRVTGNRVVTMPIKVSDSGGSIVSLYLWCENGHDHTYFFEWVEGRILVDMESGDLPGNIQPHEMWRWPPRSK